jgi:cytochrome c peroxidase
MSRRSIILISVFCFACAELMIISSCNKSDTIRKKPTTPITFTLPAGFPATVYDFNENPITEEGFALGRKLFHDNRLSANADVTCASCHQQHAAYTTFDHDLGHGTGHQHTRRNVPVIFNMAWQHEFEWDGRTKKLLDQPMACMTAPEKMGETEMAVAEKLKADTSYRRMFAEAFGDDLIDGGRMAKALTQFVVMLVSADSKYDKVKAGAATFNASEQNGYDLFKAKCNSCHAEPLFTDLSYRNNGIGTTPFHIDYGRVEVTGDAADSLKFKVPTLRNIELTGYFAHDGRYIALGQLLDHYSSQISPSPTLDPLLQNGIPLSDLEKFYIEEFLNTLTDSMLITNDRFE